MNQSTILNRAGHLSLVLCTLFLFVNANIVPKSKYTPYQILVWEIKANEGYKSWWYKDGFNRGKQAYSIGFGWNDLGNRRRKEISKYTSDRKVTFEEATEITLKEISKYGVLNEDPYKNLALQLYSYNCGPVTSGSSLGHCCGGSKGCGYHAGKSCSGKSCHACDVKKMHNSRRRFELALWNHDMINISVRTEANREKLKTYVQVLKSRGTYE
tara:strand:+ start:148 stop:786 length:639 start_codon:yes stop_codon:yes gene_type:complete